MVQGRLPEYRQIGPGEDSAYTSRHHEDIYLWHWGLRRHFPRVPLQALRFARSLRLARAAAASTRAKGNKKSAVPPSPRCSGQWPTAPSVASIQVRLQVSASERNVQSTSC
jgi:hypothetical protein